MFLKMRSEVAGCMVLLRFLNEWGCQEDFQGCPCYRGIEVGDGVRPQAGTLELGNLIHLDTASWNELSLCFRFVGLRKCYDGIVYRVPMISNMSALSVRRRRCIGSERLR
jgi:hypothetical protein